MAHLIAFVGLAVSLCAFTVQGEIGAVHAEFHAKFGQPTQPRQTRTTHMGTGDMGSRNVLHGNSQRQGDILESRQGLKKDQHRTPQRLTVRSPKGVLKVSPKTIRGPSNTGSGPNTATSPNTARRMDVDWQKEEDMTEAEMRNQLHKQDKFKKRERHHDGDQAFLDQKLHDWNTQWAHNAKKTADAESTGFASFLQMLLVIPVVGAVGVGYLLMIESDLAAVEIPGLGTVNLHKAAQDFFRLPGKKGVQKMTDLNDTPLVNPAQSSYGSYGGYGCGDSLPSAAPAAPFQNPHSAGIPADEDLGL